MAAHQSRFEKYREMARRPKTDPYAVLGVARDATDEEIKRAYHRLALEHHPDLNPDAGGGRFAEIAEAYSVLSDPEKRAYFDEHGVEGERSSRRSEFDEFWDRYTTDRSRYQFGPHRYVDMVDGIPHYHAAGVTNCPLANCPIRSQQPALRESARVLPFRRRGR